MADAINKILVISDTHSNMEMMERVIETESANCQVAAVLHPGDIGIYDQGSLERIPERERRLIEKHGDPTHNFFPYLSGNASFAIPVIAVPGNHEDFSLVDALIQGMRTVGNLKMLAPEDFAVINLNERDVTVMGLGKILPAILRENRRHDEKYIQEEELHVFREKALAVKPDILIFHDAPFLSRITAKGGLSPFGSPVIRDLILAIKPRLVLCGHMHFEYRLEMNGIVITGMGYGARGRYGVLSRDFTFEWKGVDGSIPFRSDVVPGGDAITTVRNKVMSGSQRIMLPVTGDRIIAHFGLDHQDHGERKKLGLFFMDLRLRIMNGDVITDEKALELAEKFFIGTGLP